MCICFRWIVSAATAAILSVPVFPARSAGGEPGADSQDHRIRDARASPHRQQFCVSCYQNLFPNENGFVRIPLQCRVSSWFPVDLSGDSTWLLAITTANPPGQVGVFDPKGQRWIDRPRALPPGAREWGVADYDQDGHLEYAYRKSDTIRLYDPDASAESTLWVIPFSGARQAVFWGATEAGKKCVGVSEYHFSSWTEQHLDMSLQIWQFWWKIHVFEVMSGKEVKVVAGGPSPLGLLHDQHANGTSSLAVHSESFFGFDGMGGMASRFEGVFLYGPQWEPVDSIVIMDYDRMGLEIPVALSLDHFAIHTRADQKNVFALSQLGRFGQGDSVQLRRRQAAATPENWVMTTQWFGSYTSAVAFDLERTGTVRWILPLSSGAGWERRELTTGQLVDTLGGMPKVDLRTGPLFVAATPELFYLADSSLYVWADSTAEVHNTQDDSKNAAELWVRTTPNPFRSAITLSCPTGISPTSLQIINILGQTVYSRDFRDGDNRTDVIWNGSDGRGHSLPSGLYFARVQAGAKRATVKIVLLK